MDIKGKRCESATKSISINGKQLNLLKATEGAKWRRKRQRRCGRRDRLADPSGGAVGGAQRRHDGARNNQLTYVTRAAGDDGCVRAIDHPADVGERWPGSVAARVTTLGSCGGGGGALRRSQRRDDVSRERVAVFSRIMGAVDLRACAGWRASWRHRRAAQRGMSCVRPYNFTA